MHHTRSVTIEGLAKNWGAKNWGANKHFFKSEGALATYPLLPTPMAKTIHKHFASDKISLLTIW